MDSCHVEFESKDEASLRRLTEFFAMVKAAKQSEAPVDEAHLLGYLTEDERSYFWDPTPEEMAQWNEHWFSTPLPMRHSAAMVLPQWELGSLLDAFWNGDYELVGVIQEGQRHFVAFNPHGYPYGGTGSFVALVECFGHRVVGVEDGTGYVEHVPRTEFWRPRGGEF